MQPIYVLFVYGDILRHGGIENFMMNYFRHIDPHIVHIDFAVQGEKRGAFDDEIEKAGSHIYRLSKPGQNIGRYRRELLEIFKSGNYQIVHAHCDAMNCRILRLAKSCNIPVRISHSHNTNHVLPGNSFYRKLYYEYSRKKITEYTTECYACSKEAGEWMYDGHHFEVIPNAIELDKFLFCEKKRELFREKYHVPKDAIILGHVGRFDVQKNQMFLVHLLRKLSQDKSKKFILLFVGNGWMREKIEKKLQTYHLEKQVIFAGEVGNPQDYYHMMDVFVLPSLFEGYGIVLEEAQVNGLTCLASKYIPKEADILKHIEYLPLELDLWYKKVLNLLPPKRSSDVAEELKRKGYDIHEAAKKLENKYINLYKEAVEGKKCMKYQ